MNGQMMNTPQRLVPLLMMLGLCSAAGAAELKSIAIPLELDACLVLQADDFGVTYACPGYKGYPVRLVERQNQFFVSYGFGAADRKAASQPVGHFDPANMIIEWHLAEMDGTWHPFATILHDAAITGQLTVTKIAPDAVCHIVYVDAELTADPLQSARLWATGQQTTPFDCQYEETYYDPS